MAKPIWRIFGKSDDGDEAAPISFKKLKKNELLNNDKKFINPDETSHTLKIISEHGLSKKTIALTRKDNLQMRKDLSLDDTEYFLVSIFMYKMNGAINAKHIQNFIKGDPGLIVPLLNIMFNLYHKRILFISPDEGDIKFLLSPEVLAYFHTGEFKPNMETTLKRVILVVDTIANLYNGNLQAYSDLAQVHILRILKENATFKYCQKLLEVFEHDDQDMGPHNFHQYLFYVIGHLITQSDDHTIDKNCVLNQMFYRFDPTRENLINEVFDNDDNILFKLKIFDRSIDDSGKADKNKLEIHSDFKRKYLQGIITEKSLDYVIKKDKIAKKEMFYNNDNQKQIDDLFSILKKTAFAKVKNRLKKSDMRTGFACLFSGHAGTGKTETAYQIARMTGRDIIKVDMSSLRSKWWGEDEKNVKAIFTNYKLALQESKLEPILLLNEADAIIGKRLDVSGNNGAIITSINAVQNIILEELENFEGILIATTNLTENFDSAFERRFLYKIEFQKPDLENKKKLWEHMLKLSEEDAMTLAKKYDYTGAQIENIFRKREVNNILYNNKNGLDAIIEMCDNECIKSKTKPIGFGS